MKMLKLLCWVVIAGAMLVPTAHAQCNLLDDMEGGPMPFWTVSRVGGVFDWAIITSANAQSPTHVWQVVDEGTIADHYLDLSVTPVLPFTEMRFHHTFQMEDGFDGGVLEVSIDGGSNFSDLGPSIVSGGYNGSINNCCGNPISGRSAWTGGTLGAMTEVRVDLAAYVGSSIIVRFRQSSDDSFGDLGWEIDDIEFCAQLPAVTLTATEPLRHDLSGGSLLTVYGDGMFSGVELKLRSGKTEAPLTSVVYAHGGLMAGLIPTVAPGTYDLVACDSGGNDLFVLGGAVSIVDALIPAPEDVSGARLGDDARLAWSNLVQYDAIEIRRNGALVTLLDGDSTSFTDDVSGFPGGAELDYEIIGFWNGGPSHAAEAHLAIPDPCSIGARRVLGDDRRGPERTLLRGQESSIAQTSFHLTTAATDGVLIRAHTAQIEIGGTLKARIRDLQPPQSIVVDNIFLSEPPFAIGPSWTEGSTLSTIPAGEYLIDFYVEGGDAQTAYYSMATSLDDEDRGDPYPCPPYALAAIDRICGDTPPQVIDIEAHPFDPSAPALEPNLFPSAFVGPPGATKIFQLKAVASDPNDRPIVEYRFDSFGDGMSTISSSPWVLHEFPDFGTYDVVLTVTNDLGLSSTATRTIAVLPFAGPLPAGTNPEIVTLRSSPDSFIPDVASVINMPVPGRFEVTVNTAVGDRVQSVEATLDDPNGGLIVFSQAGPNPSLWVGTFPDMSALTRRESVDLIVTAEDDQNRQTMRTFAIDLCPIPQIFGLEITDIDRSVVYDPNDHDYTVNSNYLPDPVLNLPFNLLGTAFQNFMQITATSEIFLRDMRWLAGELNGGIDVTLLNSSLYSQSWTLPPIQSGSPVECPEFSLQYLIQNIKLFDRQWDVTLLDDKHLGTITVPIWILVFFVDFYANLSLDIHLRAYLDILITLASLDPELTLDFCSTPTAEVDAEASIDARVSLFKVLKLVTLTAYLYPSIGLELPAHLQFVPQSLDISLDVAHCISVDVDYELEVKGPFGSSFGTGRKDIGFLNDLEYGGGCDLPSPCGGGFANDGPPAIGPSQIPGPSTPALAVSPGGTSLMVYSKDVGTGSSPELELYYSFDNGSGWTAPAPAYLPADLFADAEPEVAFVDADNALVVWIRNELDTPTIEALSQGDLASLNTILANQEIWFATWSVALGFGTPQRLTNDTVAQGFPKIAAVPGTNTAWVTWIEYDHGAVVNTTTGIPNEQDTSVYAHTIVAGAPSGSAVLLSSDDGGSPVADFSPTLGFGNDGMGYAVWVRETLTDRMLMTSAYDGVSFGPPTPSYGTPTYEGVDSPSIAITAVDEGIVSFTSRSARESGSVDAGNHSIVYAMPLQSGALAAFGLPQVIRPARCPEIGLAFAEEPTALSLGGGGFAVATRSLARAGQRMDSDGDLAVAAIDLGVTTPTFTAWRPLTLDGEVDYDTSFAVSGGTLRTVRTSTGADGSFDSLVLQDFSTAPDLALDAVRVSRAHPRPGTEVDLTIVLRNRGLETATNEATTLRIERVLESGVETIDTVPYTFDAVPGERLEVDYRFVVPPETTTIRVSADPIGSEVQNTNNQSEVVIGVLPPSGLTCAETAGGGLEYLVSLSWTNEDTYDSVLVYRNGRLHAELPGGAIGYLDETAGVRRHVYAVRGRIGSATSDPTGAVCEFTVEDCNGNGTADLLDVLTGSSLDCNGNLIPDECDLGKPIPDHQLPTSSSRIFTQGGTCARTNDRNCNGIPDDCE